MNAEFKKKYFMATVTYMCHNIAPRLCDCCNEMCDHVLRIGQTTIPCDHYLFVCDDCAARATMAFFMMTLDMTSSTTSCSLCTQLGLHLEGDY